MGAHAQDEVDREDLDHDAQHPMPDHQLGDRPVVDAAVDDVAEEAGDHDQGDQDQVEQHHRRLHVAVLLEALAARQDEPDEQPGQQQELRRQVDVGRGPRAEECLHATSLSCKLAMARSRRRSVPSPSRSLATL